MSELPRGWSIAPIGLLCTLENGRAFTPTEWRRSGIPIIRIQNLNNPNAAYNYFDGQFEGRYFLRGGELLFAWSGTPGTSFGAHIWRGGEAVLNQHIFRVDFDESSLDKRFFRYAINQKLEELIGIAHGGVGLRHVTKGKFEETEVSIPPLNEQKRIADKLDAVLGRVDACRERLDRVPAVLKRFRQSVLAAATSGKLTEEWRDEHGAAEWRPLSVQDIAIEIFDGPFGSHLKSKDYSEDGIRVVRLENIGWLNFVGNKKTFISNEKLQTLRKHTLKANDVLFSSFIAEEVRVCLLPAELSEKAINKADCFCVRTDPTVCSPQFLALRLACHSTFVELEEVVHGATRPRINLRQLKKFKFDLPSVAEQEEIVCRVDFLFDFIDRLDTRYAAAYDQVKRLTPALLAKAFRGQLVPQDASDEPAAILLERVRAQREAASRVAPSQEVIRITKEVTVIMQKLLDVLAAATDWLPAEEVFRRCGASDGSQTDRLEKLYAELRQLDKAGTLRVRRIGDFDELRLEPKG